MAHLARPILVRALGPALGAVCWLLCAGGALAATTAAPSEYMVQRGDTLWSIAQHFYGNGDDFPKIAAANMGRPMADGRPFSAAGDIQAGWRLLVPSAGEPNAAPPPAEYTVVAGDTLSSIAQRLLGDTDRWPALFAANRDAVNPATQQTLSDPDLIWPGLRLTLPASGVPAAATGATQTPPPASAGAPAQGQPPATAGAAQPQSSAATAGASQAQPASQVSGAQTQPRAQEAGAAQAQPSGAAAGAGCMYGWQCGGISLGSGGAASASGTAAASIAWTLTASGQWAIPGLQDQFQYAWQPAGDTVSVTARVAPPTPASTNGAAAGLAGLMLRQSAAPDSAMYVAAVNTASQLIVAYRAPAQRSSSLLLLNDRASPSPPNQPYQLPGPTFLKVARAGDAFKVYMASDGVTWREIPDTSTSLPGFGGSTLAGLIASSSGAKVTTATFDAVSIQSG